MLIMETKAQDFQSKHVIETFNFNVNKENPKMSNVKRFKENLKMMFN